MASKVDDEPVKRFRAAATAGTVGGAWQLPATQQLLSDDPQVHDRGVAVVDGIVLTGGPLSAPLHSGPISVGVADDPDASLMARSIFGSKENSRKPAKGRATSRGRNSGPGWFNLQGTEVTPEIERDLKLLDSRDTLDPTRFYKSTGRSVLQTAGKEGAFFQVGEVVSGAHEFFSSRLTKKQRRTRLVGEVMADKAFRERTKKKYQQIQDSKVARPSWKKKRRGTQRW